MTAYEVSCPGIDGEVTVSVPGKLNRHKSRRHRKKMTGSDRGKLGRHVSGSDY